MKPQMEDTPTTLDADVEAACARLHSADFHGDPFDRDDVRKLGHALTEAKQQRDLLVAECVKAFGWSDTSYLHALLHVVNAAQSFEAFTDLTTRAETAEAALAERDRALEEACREGEFPCDFLGGATDTTPCQEDGERCWEHARDYFLAQAKEAS